MFSKKEQILKKTGPSGVGRFQFLSLLVQEFEKSNSIESKHQVLANLANFSYDPINFEFIRQLHIIDIFLNQFSGCDENLLHYAVAGICNLSADPVNADYIVKNNGIFLIAQQLLHRNIEISLNALATLIFLINDETQPSITTPEIINKVLHYASSSNVRLKNLGSVFLQDYCSDQQIDFAKRSSNLQTNDIPLPEKYVTYT